MTKPKYKPLPPPRTRDQLDELATQRKARPTIRVKITPDELAAVKSVIGKSRQLGLRVPVTTISHALPTEGWVLALAAQIGLPILKQLLARDGVLPVRSGT